MPPLPMKYENTIIYKIVCNNLDVKHCYVGHTTQFTKRKAQHKNCVNNGKEFLLYKTIRDNGGWNNWSMIEIEKYSCNDRNEAQSRERYWIEQLNADLNSSIPTRTRKEYREQEEVKQKMKKYLKEYRQQEKNKQKKNKQKFTCECGSITTIINTQRHFKTNKHINFMNSLECVSI